MIFLLLPFIILVILSTLIMGLAQRKNLGFFAVSAAIVLSLAALSPVVLAFGILVQGFSLWGFWGVAQPISLLLVWLLWRELRHGRLRAKPTRYGRSALLGGALGVAVCALLSAIHSASFVATWDEVVSQLDNKKIQSMFELDKKEVFGVGTRVRALEKEGMRLVILKELVENGPDYALRGAAIAFFIFFSFDHVPHPRTWMLKSRAIVPR